MTTTEFTVALCIATSISCSGNNHGLGDAGTKDAVSNDSDDSASTGDAAAADVDGDAASDVRSCELAPSYLCMDCVDAHCCAQERACAEDPVCRNAMQCARNCAAAQGCNSQAATDCATANCGAEPQGVRDLVDCVNYHCSQSCAFICPP